MTKLTTQKIHSIIRNHLQSKCSEHSISQRVNHAPYYLFSIPGIYGVFSEKYINEIAAALTNADIKFHSLSIKIGFLKIGKVQ